ncbi:MAG: GYD domain-containing protein [Chloroflexota bacterium]
MAHYLYMAAYTAEAWANLTKNPQNRMAAVGPVAQALGGDLEQAWLSFGEYDVVALLRLPDNGSAAAFAMAVAAGGAVKAAKTVPLLTLEEGVEAMRQAGGAGYRPPAGS